MKKLLAGAALLSVASIFAVTATVAEAKTTLRLGHVLSLKSISGVGSLKFKEVAEKNSDGELEIQLFPSGQLGGELEMVSQVRLGSLDMAMTGSGVVANIEPAFSITELPFIWKSDKAAWKVLNGPIGQKLLARLDSKGIKGLGWGVWGMRGLLTNGFAINSPADLKGKKIRIIENPLYVQTIRAFGANPVPMAWPEVYSALQQKTIDGVETNYHGMADAKLYEAAKNLVVSDHIWTATVFMINAKKLASLPKKQQEALAAAAKAAGEAMFVAAAKANADGIALMEKNGVKVTRPDRKPFAAAVGPVHKFFAGRIGADLLKQVKDAQE